MKKQVYEVDANGHIEEIYVVKCDEQGTPIDVLPEHFIVNAPPAGLYRAKWTGSDWIEDMPQEEIDEINNIQQPPTIEERLVSAEQALLAIMEVLS